jgi:hypothetical protein
VFFVCFFVVLFGAERRNEYSIPFVIKQLLFACGRVESSRQSVSPEMWVSKQSDLSGQKFRECLTSVGARELICFFFG